MHWIFVAAGAVMSGYILVQLIRYRRSGQWPTAMATVKTAEVRRVRDPNGGHYFVPALVFTYVVAGEYYSGEWVGPAYSSEEETRFHLQKNTPIDTQLTVRYKPKDPSLNMLDMDMSLWDKNRPITLDI